MALATVLAAAAAPALFAPWTSAAPVGQGLTVTPSDLSHILRQIKIAEHHVANTTTATGPCGAMVGPGPDQIANPLIADGLRTVDGSCNNLVAGHETFGAEGELFPRLSSPRFKAAEGRPQDFFGPGDPGSASSTYADGATVYDSQPRLVSNLIVDQTSTNPAAADVAGHPARSQDPNGLACAQTLEVQSISGTPAGDFTLTLDGATTGPIPAAATAAEVDAALDAIVSGGVNVVGGPLPSRIVVTFNGTPGDVAELTASDPAVTVATLTQGVAPTSGADDCQAPFTTLKIENITTDAGLSPPFNSLFTIFGQFFDHGVDKTAKPGGTVFVPLKSDDPLVAGPDHVLGTADDLPASRRFMPLTRAAKDPNGPDNVLGTADDDREAVNTDTPFVDQSQTYTSHPSHQVFLREYALVAGAPRATGKLINGSAATGGVEGGQANWSEVKAQAASVLGLKLRDQDVLDIPMIATDPYGNFVPGPHGFPQYLTATGLVEGDPAANANTGVEPPADVRHFTTAFLDDIAHTANPKGDLDGNPATPGVGILAPDPGDEVGNTPGPGQYDDDLLAKHFIAGDGRVNENIALTAVHQIFHSEHNRLVDDIQTTLDRPENAALKASYEATGAATFDYGERLFQAARFVTEMEYQHLVFEEFARKVQPLINPFAGFAFTQANINPAVKAEFAHAVYRFGHSMLTDRIARVSVDPATGTRTAYDISLLNGFLNPVEYDKGAGGSTQNADTAAGNIIMGISDDAGNEIDEFTTETLRNNLLGLPLDLPTINMTRARSEGIPSLNEFRRELYATTNDSQLKPYTDWVDFGLALKNPASLVNFVAAYGRHPSVLAETTLAGKRAAARLIVDAPLPGSPADASDFMNRAGTWAGQETGLDTVDLWVGGLAERTNLFGGLLGSTFNFVFESQLTDLQNSDRLYYLGRTPGMNLRAQLEGNSFAELVMRNTNAQSLKSDAFATADCKFELGSNPGIANILGGNIVQDDPNSECDESAVLIRMADGTIRYRERNSVDPPGINGQSVYNGTAGIDRIHGGNDSDTFWGNDNDDIIEGGDGADVVLGGEGNDKITDSNGDDVLKGGPGNDRIEAGPGLDIIMGATGKDMMNGGANINEIFAGPGDDFMILGQGEDLAQGDSGDDWMEGGDQPDLLQGDSGTLFFTDRNTPGHDVMIGQAGDDDYDAEGGDDVMIADPGIEKSAGSAGFDWYTGARDPVAQNADLNIRFLPGVAAPQPAIETRDRFNEVEALSGGPLDDTLRGDDIIPSQVTGGGFIGCDALDQASLDRIAGLDPIVPPLTVPSGPVIAASLSHECTLSGNVWGEGNILLGGGGTDVIEGRGGDDIIDGDRYLDVRLSVRTDPADPSTQIGTTDLIEHPALVGDFGPGTAGKTLERAVMDGDVDPGNIVAVREILLGSPAPDTAVFSDVQGNYDVDFNADGSVTVAHARGTLRDGTDTLRNVESLRFTDGVRSISPVDNLPPVGTVQVSDPVPQVGLSVTAVRSFTDPDGINEATVTFRWEAQTGITVWTQVGTGPTYIPTAANVGQRLRVVVEYTDNDGHPESLTSAPSQPVVTPVVVSPPNVPATGQPAVVRADGSALGGGRPRVGDPVAADTSGIQDADGPTVAGVLGVTYTYQWQRNTGTGFADILGATARQYTPVAGDLGATLRVAVRFTDGRGSAEGPLFSAATIPVRQGGGGGRALLPAITRAALPAVTRSDAVARQGVAVGLTAGAGTRLIEVRVASARRPKVVLARVVLPARAGRSTVALRHPGIRRLLSKGGRFRIELRAGASRTALGAPTVRMITVRRGR